MTNPIRDIQLAAASAARVNHRWRRSYHGAEWKQMVCKHCGLRQHWRNGRIVRYWAYVGEQWLGGAPIQTWKPEERPDCGSLPIRR